jgi:hypothetical protein
LADLKELIMSILSCGDSFDKKYHIKNTPKVIGRMIKSVFLIFLFNEIVIN